MAHAGQGAIPAAPAAPTTTYFDLFSDAANNTMDGHVQTLLAPYNDFNNFTPVQVEDLALSGRQGQPAVTYCFIVYHEESERIHAYINPSTYTASPIRTTPHDGEIFIQIGDLMEQQFSLAIWPRSMYHQSNNMLVPTAAQLDNLIAADPDDELFGPFQANDPNVELIRTRYCCLVPHAYVPLVIDRPHTPKELWTTLRGAIVTDQLEQQCEPLINYLRACMSRPTPNDLSHLALDSEDLPTVVALDPDLIAHRRRLLYEDFPHFNNAVGHAQATLVSQGIHALTQEVHLGRIESQQERDRARNKTFQSEYPASYDKLLTYAQVQNGNLLQPVWNQLARSKKGDRIRILSQHLELAKQQLQLTYVKVDTTPGILEKILNLQFHSASAAGDFKEYFNSFLLDTSNSSVVQQATLYETLHSGGAAPSAADLQLISGLDIKASTDTVSYLHLIQKYLIYHQCLWGGAHPVTTNLATYYRMLNQKQVELQMYQAGCELNGRLLFWPRLQFKLQTEVDYWFDMASYPNVRPADLPPLNTHGVFQSIRLHQQWEPVMGSHFLEQLGLTNVNPSPSLTTGGLQGRDDSDSRAPPGGNRTITNPTFNADLFNQYREDRSMRARDVRSRWLAAGLELPKSRVDSNKTMCLAYHVKGTCNEGCNSSYDHVPYSASQYAPMELNSVAPNLSPVTFTSIPIPSVSPTNPLQTKPPSNNDAKRIKVNVETSVKNTKLPHHRDIGKLIESDADLFRKVGWRKFIQIKRGRVDLATTNINHPAGHVLNQYRKRGVPVRFKTKPWSKERIDEALQRGSHRSCFEYLDFLEEEFVDMMQKGQWIILPFEDVQSLPNLRLSPPGVVPQRERRPRWIVDYSFYNINEDTLPLVLDSMQFGHALDRILREILLSNPNHGPVQLMKVDLSDGFYRLCLNIDDIPKLGVTFPSATHNNLVAFPLVLPMGWKNSPPAFCTATETIADLANRSLQAGSPSAAHPLSKHAAPMDGPISPPTATATALQPPFVSATTLNSSLSQTDIPTVRDPSLPFPMTLLQYIDVFVDDFIALAQTGNRNYVRDTLLHAIDTVFRPNDFYDSEYRREPVSLKKLRKGDCSWSTIKLVLGWIINTVAMTIELPQHRQERLGAILSSIPSTQKRIGVKKWHKLLGELRSMALALPGARCMFGMMQEALRSLDKRSRISLRKGVHQSIADFQWMLKDISKRPTRIAELVPLLPSALGFHDASGEGAGGVWFPSHTIGSRMKNKNTLHPLLWRYKWPQDIIDDLVTEDNPQGKITNSDLELAGGLLHLDVIAHCLDVRERTLVSKTDNLATLFWERKGSATNAAVTHQLLRLFGIHQRFHRYVPRHDYISGPSNPLADDSSQIHLQNCAPDTKADFWRDLGFAEQEVREGVTTGRSAAADTHWEKWIEFTSVLGQDPLLQTVEDKVPYLQVFLHRVRHGFYAANKNPIRARSAEDYLRSIGQTYLELGEQDPRINCHDNIDFRLARMIKSYKKKDPPPNRVKPVPLSVIRRIAQIAFSGNSFNQHATADMIIIAFFFLLRPGEYSYSNTDSDPFLLADVQFWIGHQRLNTMTATPTQLRQATFVSLTFTTQKNGVRGEVIGLSCSGEFYLCPVKALARRVIHLKQHNAAPNTPLCTYFCQERQRLVHVCPSDITNTLRTNVAALGPALGFLPSDVSARCLRAAGANALLCANVDSDVIRLLGRWRSDEMLRYLHLQNSQLMQHFSQRMLTGGNFTLIPNQEVPLF